MSNESNNNKTETVVSAPSVINFLNNDFTSIEKELNEFVQSEIIKIDVNKELEEAIAEMESIKQQLSEDEGDTLIELCKTTILDTVTGQFGLASMFINCKDGGNVTTTHNFEKGVVEVSTDKVKYKSFIENNDGSIPWNDVRNKTGYDTPLPQKRKEAFQTQDIIIDDYTGRQLPKDGRAHLDHIVSAKEIESNAAMNLHMSPEQRAKMATKDANLAWCDASANQSKGSQKMKDWLDSPDKDSGSKEEKYGIDREMALEKDKNARKSIKKEINQTAFKNYSKELLKTGGRDAAKMAAYSAIGVVMREFIQATFDTMKQAFINRENESLKDIFVRFKEQMKEVIKKLKDQWKDILQSSIEGGLTAFFSNLLVFVINLFATTLKKIVHMIRAGFVSLVQAFKIMTNPPEGMTKDEAQFQAVKIMTAGLIGAASLGLSAAVEKFLQTIPGLQPIMMFPIPFSGETSRTVSDILAVTLTSLMGGILTTVTIYAMDKFRNDGKKGELQIQLVYKSGIVVDYKTIQSWLLLKNAYEFLQVSIKETGDKIIASQEIITHSEKEIDKSHRNYETALNKLENLYN
jgi:hypothetical protein